MPRELVINHQEDVRSVLRDGFSAHELREASFGVIGQLKDQLVGVRRLGWWGQMRSGGVKQVEVYQGPLGMSARVYFGRKKNQEYVPTYVVCTATALADLQKYEQNLSSDPAVEDGY